MSSIPREVSRSALWLLLALVVVATSALRLSLIAAGPDPDIDAYLHFHIGMRLVDERATIAVHWVWLPLWHLVDAAVYALGGGITAVRHLSLAFTALSSFALTALLRRHLAAHPAPAPWLADAERVIPFAAGALFALWPMNLRGGASAEPEALFQLLLLAAALAWQSRRAVAVGVALSLAAMLRYEAWPVVGVFFALWAIERRTARDAPAWALPAALVGAWCVAHRAGTGEWLKFLRDNRAYVELAWRELRIDERDLPSVRFGPLWYVAGIPFAALREWVVWLAPGAVWLARRGPRPLTWTSAALLALVTAVWFRRHNLGLERHFAALVPAYATMAAAGLVATVAWFGARVHPRVARAVVAVALCLAASGIVRWRVRSAWHAYRRTSANAWVDERAAADLLRRRSLPDATVFTQSPHVKVLAGLPLSRYVDWDPAALRDFNLLVECVHHGEVWVAARPDQVTELREGIDVLHRGDALVLLRRRAPATFDRALLRTTRPCR